jgi:hypothetical protein
MAVKYLSDLNLNKNELQLARVHNLATAPGATNSEDHGLLYYNTGDDKLYMWNGTAFIDVSGDIKSVTSSTTDQITVANSGGPNPIISAVLGTVATNSNGLLKGSTVFDYLYANAQKITVAGTANETTVVTDNTDNTKLQLGNTLTIGLPDDVTIGNDLTVSGDLIVNGSTTTVNSTTVTIDDPVFTLGGDTAPASDDNKDRGIEFRYHDGTAARLGFFGYDDSTGLFTFLTTAANNSEVFSGTKGSLDIGNIKLSGSIKSYDGVTPAAGQILVGHSAQGDMQLATITAGSGIVVTNGDGAIAIGAESASATNAGIVELATTAEALAGADTTRAVTPAGLAARSFVGTVGDGSATTINVSHGLSTRNVIVQLYDAATFDTVITDVVRTTSAVVTLTFATAPTSNAIKVLITRID